MVLITNNYNDENCNTNDKAVTLGFSCMTVCYYVT